MRYLVCVVYGMHVCIQAWHKVLSCCERGARCYIARPAFSSNLILLTRGAAAATLSSHGIYHEMAVGVDGGGGAVWLFCRLRSLGQRQEAPTHSTHPRYL